MGTSGEQNRDARSAYIVTMQAVRDNGWIVVGKDVFDVSPHAVSGKHKGGDFLAQYRGMDATFSLLNAHGKDGRYAMYLRPFRIGTLDESTRDAADNELYALYLQFKERGLFEYKKLWIALDFIQHIGLFLLGYILVRYNVAAGLAVLTLANLNVFWWAHDVGHDSVFATQKRSKLVTEIASILFAGTPSLTYQYKIHRLHHGLTNVIGGDRALETGPFVWHETMLPRSSPLFVRLQAFLWFALALPFTFPLFLAANLFDIVRQRQFVKTALLAIRWLVVGYLVCDGHWLWALAPMIIAGYALGLIAALNHFHLPLSSAVSGSFARSVCRVTQNMSHTSRLATWLTGGLNFHIEHHFFANMPRRNYAVISPEIQAFCAKHGLRYNQCNIFTAVDNLYSKLRKPFAEHEGALTLEPGEDAELLLTPRG